MPAINVYLPADLHEAVKAADLPVSDICKRALARELQARRRRRISTPDGRTADWPNTRRT